MFVANTDNDVLTGRGRLYVLRADPSAVPYSSHSASRLRRNSPVRATFVPVDGEAARSAATLEPHVQSLACLNFVRLEGLAIDREKPNSFYFTDRLGYGQGTFVQTAAGGGRQEPVSSGARRTAR